MITFYLICDILGNKCKEISVQNKGNLGWIFCLIKLFGNQNQYVEIWNLPCITVVYLLSNSLYTIRGILHITICIRWSADQKEIFLLKQVVIIAKRTFLMGDYLYRTYVANGYFGCRPHANYVCGESLKVDTDTNTNIKTKIANLLLVLSLKEKKQI